MTWSNVFRLREVAKTTGRSASSKTPRIVSDKQFSRNEEMFELSSICFRK